MFWFLLAKWILFIPLMILMPTRVKGFRNIPFKGPAILLCNHLSYMDVFVLAVSSRRAICYMAKSEFFENRFLGWILRHCNAFPVKRDTSDISAIKHCLEVTNKGRVLGIFPEGTTKGKLAGPVTDIKQGAAMIALKSKAPIVPAMFKKKPTFFIPNTLIIGEAFTLDEYYDKRIKADTLDEVTEIIKDRMDSLLENGAEG